MLLTVWLFGGPGSHTLETEEKSDSEHVRQKLQAARKAKWNKVIRVMVSISIIPVLYSGWQWKWEKRKMGYALSISNQHFL